MSELFPDDAALLALTEDVETGVPYIPTGLSPYYVEFRRLLHRLLRASGRANDLRVYQDGPTTIGVRGGRCLIGGHPVVFEGVDGIVMPSQAVTFVWLDESGAVQTGGAFPAARSTFVPLAEVVTEGATIAAVVDRRGEAFLHVPSAAALGLTTTVDRINAALAGTTESVDADALNRLTAGATSTADSEHRHLQVTQYADDEATFTLFNGSSAAEANAALVFNVPQRFSGPITMSPDPLNGFVRQRYGGTNLHLLGVTALSFVHQDDLTDAQVDRVMGVAAVDGVVHDVVLAVGANMESSSGTDGITAVVKVNGVAVAATDPTLQADDGAGRRSTAQGDGLAAVIKNDGTELVQRGDLLTVDVTRDVGGTVSSEARDVVVLVVMRARRPI
jgi:hypothetical protein